MSDTTPIVETVKTEAPSNNATPTATPQVNAVDAAEVERLRKEKEQADMRIRQLENEAKKRQEAEEAARLTQLEEQNEWKTVAEQTKARLEALEKEKEAEQRSKELANATDSVLAEFPDAVKAIAKETGLGVTDATEEAQAAFKAKLESIAKQLPQVKVSSNNQPVPAPTNNNLSTDEMREALQSDQGFHDLASKLPSVAAMQTRRQ